MVLSFAPTALSLAVQDNGSGFDAERALERTGRNAGWGLLGMRERTSLIGGHMTINSSPGRGACIAITLPTSPEWNRVNHSLATGR